MKKIFSLLLVFVMLFSLAVPTFASTDKKGTVAKEETIKVKLCNYVDANGKWVKEKYIDFDVAPIIIDGRTMVPIRAVAEELGWRVNWQNGMVKIVKIISSKNVTEPFDYENYNQFNRFVNLLYNLEAGNKTDNTKNFILKSYYEVKNGRATGRVEPLKNQTSIGTLLDMKSEHSKHFCIDIPVSKIGRRPLIFLENGSTGGISFTYKFSDVEPQIIDGRTLIPLRGVGEMMGLDVFWDEDNRIVTISA